MGYKAIDGFLSAEEAVDKIKDLVDLGYDEKDITVLTKEENKEQLERRTSAKIDIVTKNEDKGMLGKIKETFGSSSSDETDPLGAYDLDEPSRIEYNEVIYDNGFVLLVEDKTSFTMGRERQTTQPSENTSMTSGKTGDFNETPGGVNPIIPGTGMDADNAITRNSNDIHASSKGTSDVQDKFNHTADERKRDADEEVRYIENHEVTQANEELNREGLTDNPVDSNTPGASIDPKIPPQSLEPMNVDSAHLQNDQTIESDHRDR